MLLIMSCHTRLIDAFTSIFLMTKACIEHSIAPHLDKNANIVLPKLQIGSHETPEFKVDGKTMLSPSMSAMYMLLIVMFSTKLCDQMIEIIEIGQGKDLASREEKEENSSSRSPQQALWDSMKDKTAGLAQDIDATRCLLQRSPAMSL